MLVLSRRRGEWVTVEGPCRVVLVSLNGDTAQLGFEAERSVTILREEVPRRPEPLSDNDFKYPEMARVLQAVPMIQWRRCWKCNQVDLYRDNMLPACRCHACGSADTRIMREESALLHGRKDSE